MRAPSTEQLLEQNGKSNTYNCVIKCDCYSLLIKVCPQAKLLIMVNSRFSHDINKIQTKKLSILLSF